MSVLDALSQTDRLLSAVAFASGLLAHVAVLGFVAVWLFVILLAATRGMD